MRAAEARDGSVKRCLIVAGDVATKLGFIEEALSALRERFDEVFYCVGNHELWRGGRAATGFLDERREEALLQ